MLLAISQNSQENTCARVPFLIQNTDKECEDYDLKNQITYVTKLVLNLTRKI